MQPFVDVEWVLAHRDELVVADVRWYLDGRSGRAAYEQGHLPGAVFVDLDRHLAAPGNRSAGRHPLPEPGDFARAMSELGIGDTDPVVAYDDAGGVIAARLAWMLRALGHPAAVLDGGLPAYAGELEAGTVTRPVASFTVRPWPAGRIATIVELDRKDRLLLDARDPTRYAGEHEPVDPRAGHIPGARSLPARANVDVRGRLLPRAALERRFAAAGVTDASCVVSYCGSGVTACHNLLALEHAGLGHGRLYAGSWSQYSADGSRPAATGPDP